MEHRKLRRTFNEPGHVHELTFSCFQRLPLLADDEFKALFLECLGRARKKHRFEVLACVIMPEHVHVLVRPMRENYSIGNILRSIKQPVGQRAIAMMRETWLDLLSALEVREKDGSTAHRFGRQVADMIEISSIPKRFRHPLDICTRIQFVEGWSIGRLTGNGRVPRFKRRLTVGRFEWIAVTLCSWISRVIGSGYTDTLALPSGL